MDFSDEIPGFLIESGENLAQLDLEMVALEKQPHDEALIASIFRTIHTIKGTSGFFGFELLGSITHVAENILGQVRERQRTMTPELVSLILETVDAVRRVLARVEATGSEGPDEYEPLRVKLEEAFHRDAGVVVLPEPAPVLVENKPAPMPTENFVPTSCGEAVKVIELEAGPIVPQREFVERRSDRCGDGGDPGLNRRAEDQGLAHSTIRVDVSLLDKLMNLVGELVLARNQIVQTAAQSPGGSATAQRLNLITTELQEGVMRTRMQPIGTVWNKLPRVVRDLASELGKKIEIQMEGAETELDKTIIEAIKDPLTHIVRNSCDHGIESPESRVAKGKAAAGTIWLRAFHEGGHVNIEITDDGAGISVERLKTKAIQKGLIRAEQTAQMSDWEALRLIFMPGFSTAEKITSVSGRGVGMDVVKTNIEKISGTVELVNRANGGTTIKIKIPLTLAIIPGLIVSVRGDGSGRSRLPGVHRFVIPQANLLELVRLEGDKITTQIEKIHGVEVYRRRGKLLPLAYLSDVLGMRSTRADDGVRNIVVVKAEDTAFGLVVDEVNDTQEIVVKALGKQLKRLSCYVGATIMGDGKIALILDVMGLARLANVLSRPLDHRKVAAAAEARASETNQMLLFRAGRFGRLVLDLSLVARLEEIARTRLEYAIGSPVVRYRDAILPLVSLSSLLDPGGSQDEMDAPSLQVIVFSEGRRFVGLVVDEILDIVDDVVSIKQPSTAFGLLGSGVVGGKVTDFIDLEAILAAAKTHPAGNLSLAAEHGRTVLIVDPRRIARGLLRSYLEMHGHRVIECAGIDAAIEKLEKTTVDVVLSALDLGGDTGDDLVGVLRRTPECVALPVIGLAAEEGREAGRAAFDACVAREDRASILQAIHRLTQPEWTPCPLPVAQHEFALAGSL
jgi:two-component system chemotaxis sensor kinase CheA